MKKFNQELGETRQKVRKNSAKSWLCGNEHENSSTKILKKFEETGQKTKNQANILEKLGIELGINSANRETW